MHSLLRWIDNQLKACQQPPWVRQVWVRNDEVIHPLRGSGLTYLVRLYMPRIWFLILEHIRFDCVAFVSPCHIFLCLAF
jgi:hypothetical protein